VAVLVMLAVCVLVRVRLGGVRVLVRVRRVAAGMLVLMRAVVVRVLVRVRFFFVCVRMSMIRHLKNSSENSCQRSAVSIFIDSGRRMCDVNNSSKRVAGVKAVRFTAGNAEHEFHNLSRAPRSRR